MATTDYNYISSKFALGTYKLAGLGTIHERLIGAWEEIFARVSRNDIPSDLRSIFDEIEAEFDRVYKEVGEHSMPHCLNRLTEDEAAQIAEKIVHLTLAFEELA